MSGLMVKDFLVFKKRFKMIFRVMSGLLLLGVIVFLPSTGAEYVALLLPPMSVAFLAEIITTDEKSEWKKYLPTLPITHKEIVLSRYVFCAILAGTATMIAVILCGISAIAFGQITMSSISPKILIGLFYAVMMLIIGIPCGYFFKGEICTGAMIATIFLLSVFPRSILETVLLSATSPLFIIIVLLVTAALFYGSFRLSLLIYSQRIRLKEKGKI